MLMKYSEETRSAFMQSAEKVAPFLLGKLLCRRFSDGGIRKFRICEVEAYVEEDTANYGYCFIGRKKSKAVAPLFKDGGICCLYGGMLLIVCGFADKPDNILVRACADKEKIYNGPLKVADALKVCEINWQQGIDILNSDVLWLETDDGTIGTICKTERVRLGANASPEDGRKQCRFITI